MNNLLYSMSTPAGKIVTLFFIIVIWIVACGVIAFLRPMSFKAVLSGKKRQEEIESIKEHNAGLSSLDVTDADFGNNDSLDDMSGYSVPDMVPIIEKEQTPELTAESVRDYLGIEGEQTQIDNSLDASEDDVEDDVRDSEDNLEENHVEQDDIQQLDSPKSEQSILNDSSPILTDNSDKIDNSLEVTHVIDKYQTPPDIVDDELTIPDLSIPNELEDNESTVNDLSEEQTLSDLGSTNNSIDDLITEMDSDGHAVYPSVSVEGKLTDDFISKADKLSLRK